MNKQPAFYPPNPVEPASRAVLITGCSSGIGRAAATTLARRGFIVFASVRKEADADTLRQMNEPDLVPVCPLDLAHPEHLPRVLEVVQNELARRKIGGLYGILNNAGGGTIAPLELMDLDAYRADLLARLAGPVMLLQAFLPLIRQAQGRVLWITTPALLPIPYLASIHACDFAANCLARTLDLELRTWKIPSIMIRCGGIQTAAAGRTAQELAEAMRCWPQERLRLYGDALHKELEELNQFNARRSDPHDVARVVYQALTVRKPKRRYSVGYMSRFAAFFELFPQKTIDSIMTMRNSAIKPS